MAETYPMPTYKAAYATWYARVVDELGDPSESSLVGELAKNKPSTRHDFIQWQAGKVGAMRWDVGNINRDLEAVAAAAARGVPLHEITMGKSPAQKRLRAQVARVNAAKAAKALKIATKALRKSTEGNIPLGYLLYDMTDEELALVASDAWKLPANSKLRPADVPNWSGDKTLRAGAKVEMKKPLSERVRMREFYRRAGVLPGAPGMEPGTAHWSPKPEKRKEKRRRAKVSIAKRVKCAKRQVVPARVRCLSAKQVAAAATKKKADAAAKLAAAANKRQATEERKADAAKVKAQKIKRALEVKPPTTPAKKKEAKKKKTAAALEVKKAQKKVTEARQKTKTATATATTTAKAAAKADADQSMLMALKGHLRGFVGDKTEILTTARACLAREPARYRLAEVGNLVPSHSGLTFRKNSSYPVDVQERRYDRDKAEQAKVIDNSRVGCFEPAILINTDPTPISGPPICTPDGAVLGGNSRAMVLQRIYRDPPKRNSFREDVEDYEAASGAAKEYRRLLERSAGDFGFPSGGVRMMKNPVLVRVIDLPPIRDMTTAQYTAHAKGLANRVRAYNEGLTQELGGTARQVATSKRIDGAIVAELVQRIRPDESLTDFFKSTRSQNFVAMLRQKDVITRQQQNALIKNGKLTDDGARYVSRALVAVVLPDADTLDLLFDALPSLRENLARAVPAILAAGEVGPGWQVKNALPDAARLFSAARSSSMPVDQFVRQGALFGSSAKLTTATTLLADILGKRNGPIRLAGGFRKFAGAAAGTQTIDMFATPTPPVQALADAFNLPLLSGPEILLVGDFAAGGVQTGGNPNRCARGDSCNALSTEDRGKGIRLFSVTIQHDGKREKHCFRSPDMIRWVSIGIPNGAGIPCPISWHGNKGDAEKAAAGSLGYGRTKVRKAVISDG